MVTWLTLCVWLCNTPSSGYCVAFFTLRTNRMSVRYLQNETGDWLLGIEIKQICSTEVITSTQIILLWSWWITAFYIVSLKQLALLSRVTSSSVIVFISTSYSGGSKIHSCIFHDFFLEWASISMFGAPPIEWRWHLGTQPFPNMNFEKVLIISTTMAFERC